MQDVSEEMKPINMIMIHYWKKHNDSHLENIS